MRATITINDTLLLSLKTRAVQSGVSVSSLVEDAIRNQLLEDLYDIDLADSRAKEKTKPFEELVAAKHRSQSYKNL